MKQTAVEYLQQHFKTLIQEDKKGLYKLLFEQALEMERTQIQQSFQDGQWDVAKYALNTQNKTI